MTTAIKTVVYPVTDLEAAKGVYRTLLGSDPVVDEPYYVGFQGPGQHVGLDPNGHRNGQAGPVTYWHVDDIEATIAALVEQGATPAQPVTEVGGGKRTATVTDPDQNLIALLQEPS